MEAVLEAAPVREKTRWLAPLHRLDEGWLKVETALVSLLMGAMLLLGTAQIVMWNCFHQGLAWADPLLRHLVLWTAMIGGSMATSAQRHLNMDAIPRFLPPRVKTATTALVNLAAACIVGALAWVSVIFVQQEAASGVEAGFLHLARWQVQLILPIAFTLMSARFLMKCLDNLEDFLRRDA